MVGAGPAGLFASAALSAVGHDVTLFGHRDDGPSSVAPTGLWSPGLRALASLNHRAVVKMIETDGTWVTDSGVSGAACPSRTAVLIMHH